MSEVQRLREENRAAWACAIGRVLEHRDVEAEDRLADALESRDAAEIERLREELNREKDKVAFLGSALQGSGLDAVDVAREAGTVVADLREERERWEAIARQLGEALLWAEHHVPVPRAHEGFTEAWFDKRDAMVTALSVYRDAIKEDE